MTFKEGTHRERTPQGITRGTHNREITKTLTTKETGSPEITTENSHQGETKTKTNPHGMYKIKEIQESNPHGEIKEIVTQ